MPHTKYYKTHIQQVRSEAGDVERKISYWCFSPGLAMKDLIDNQVRCVILASGTLSPLSSFASEMLLDFPIRLENSHVIKADQTENSKSIWDRLNEQKKIFVEPKSKYEFNHALNGYYSKIKDPAFDGAIFLAVCRGKVSEGVDFANGRGRAVVITGIPFPNTTDQKIKQKKDFLDDMRSVSANRTQMLSGNEWYQQQALRAVNQAIGRVIRHRNDYGAILLCDERFGSTAIINQLSAWLRDHVKIYRDFGEVQINLTRFFKNMKQKHSSEPSAAISYDRTKATQVRKYERTPMNVGSEEEGYGQITSRPQSYSDYPIINDSQPLTTISNSSGEISTNVHNRPKATVEQAQKYSKEIETMGPAKHLQYKKLIRQYKKREIQIEPFIDGLIDIFIGENRLDLLHQFRQFLPSKHIQIFDRAIRAQEQIPDTSDVSETIIDVHYSKKQRID
ncbi:Regulator of telomere elongation helicase 1 [Umbelopsis sp. WA50703]